MKHDNILYQERLPDRALLYIIETTLAGDFIKAEF